MLSVLKKVKVWNGSPNPKALELLCQKQALDSIADYIMLQDKISALTAIKSVKVEDYGKIISRLDSRLDMMVDIYRCSIRRMYDTDIATTTGIKIFTVKKFKPVARQYDYEKVKHCRKLIALFDGVLRDGANIGVLEGLIALW
jgi:hypothetical protein